MLTFLKKPQIYFKKPEKGQTKPKADRGKT